MSVISRKNQVTLPVEAMRAAGLRRGDDLRIEVRGPGRLELIRTDDPRRGVRRRLRRGRLPGRLLGRAAARVAVAVFDADVLIAYLGRDARGHDGVRLESFDEKVVTAFAALHPVTPDLR